MLLLLLPLLAVWLVKRTRLASWWNPSSWFNDAVNAAGGTLAGIEQWVLSEIQKAVGLVESDIADTANFFGNIIHTVVHDVDWGINAVATSVNQVKQWAQDAVSGAIHLAENLYNQAVSYARAAVSIAVQAFNQALTQLRRYADAAIGQAEKLARLAVNAAIQWAQRELTALGRLARQWVNDAVKWAQRAINDAFATLYRTILRDFIRPIMDVVNVLEKAWDWIAWFATHPFTVVHDIESDVIHWTDHLPEEIETIVTGRRFAQGTNAVGRFFGG